MDRLRVLQIVSGVAIGAQSGGAEQFAARLAIGLDDERFERSLFAMWRYGGRAEEEWLSKLGAAGVRVSGLVQPTGQLWSDLGQVLRACWHTAEQWRPEIVNSHSERGDALNAVLHLFHASHPLSVRTMHTDQQWQERPWAEWVFTKGIFPALFDQEIAISEQTRAVLDRRPLARALRKRSQLFYNGIDAAWFIPRVYEAIPPPPAEHPALIVVGRLARQKGHADLLKALARVREHLDAHLWIVGVGPLEDALRQQACSLGIAHACHFLGSRKDVAGLLSAVDLMVSSSLWEGFPTVILEAMALKTPVVATQVSGSRELVTRDQTGLLVPPGQPDALADAILRMLTDPAEAARMAERAWVKAQGFTIEKTISRYAEMYEELGRRRC